MKHVVVIDDEREILACLEEALSGEGYRVTACVSGTEAMGLLAHEEPDLVMLDLRMPDVNGIEVLQSLRHNHPRVPIIICSALMSYKTDFDVVSSNVAAFLEKPLDLDNVLGTVRNLIGPSAPPPDAHDA